MADTPLVSDAQSTGTTLRYTIENSIYGMSAHQQALALAAQMHKTYPELTHALINLEDDGNGHSKVIIEFTPKL